MLPLLCTARPCSRLIGCRAPGLPPLPQALMHLASDAVRAAAESPFLEGALGGASGVLCCIGLPPVAQQFAGAAGGGAGVLQGVQVSGGGGPRVAGGHSRLQADDGWMGGQRAVQGRMRAPRISRLHLTSCAPPASAATASCQTPDGERRAVHMAAQAAAGALGSLAGAGGCQDYILCAEPRPPAEAQGDGSLVQVEVTLLVLRPPEGGGGGAPRAAVQQPPAFRVGPAVPAPPRTAPPQPQRLPASTWKQLSAMAGGAAGGKAGAAPAAPNGAAPAAAAAAAKQQPQAPQQPQRAMPNFFGGGTPRARPQSPASAPQQQPAAAAAAPPAPAAALQPQVQQRAAPAPAPAAAAAPKAAAAAAAAAEDQERRVTVGEYLSDSMTAQSLDLPPAVSAGVPPLLSSRDGAGPHLAA